MKAKCGRTSSGIFEHFLRGLVCLLALTVQCASASAQELPKVLSPLAVEPDRNNINITTGQTAAEMPVLSIPADPNLRFDLVQNVAAYFVGSLAVSTEPNPSDGSYSIHTGDKGSESFRCDVISGCDSVMKTGATFLPAGRVFRQAQTGTVYRFGRKYVDTRDRDAVRTRIYYATRIEYTSGQAIDIEYQSYAPSTDTLDITLVRPVKMTSSFGYFIEIKYVSNIVNTADWSVVQEASLYKTGDSSIPLARLTYAQNGQVTDLAGRTFTIGSVNNNQMDGVVQMTSLSVKLPSESAFSREVLPLIGTWPQMVSTARQDGVEYAYSYQNLQFNATALVNFYDGISVSGPDGFFRNYTIERMDPGATQGRSPVNVIRSVTDEIGRSTQYAYDPGARLITTTYPEGNGESITYDGFGNINTRTIKAKPASGLSDLIESTFVDANGCTGVLCHRPIWYRDFLGRQTDYAYNANGQLTEQTDPADSTGLRRKTIIEYESVPVGTTTHSRRKTVRICGVGTTCGTSSDIRTTYTYFGNTELPQTVTTTDGGTNVSRTTTYTYDNAGRLLSEDGPLADDADSKQYRYDIIGRKTWEIGPAAPDGVRQALRYTYRPSDNKPVLVETGTVPDATSAALFIINATEMTYDSRRNVIRERTYAGSTNLKVTDRSFLNRGLAECTTVRMNLDALPAATANGACSLGTQGAQGPDRISRNLYDAAGRLLKVQKAVGTALQQDYATYGYTWNGKQASVTDAKGNIASMTFDGHDRQVQWNFPSPSTPGVVSSTDFEAYTYDAVGNRTSLRKRDGQMIYYSYDALNRVVFKDVPGSSSDVAYGYNLLGLQTYARFGWHSGLGVTNTYDGFGQITSSSNNMSGMPYTLSYQYDVDGNRTAITYPDGISIIAQYQAPGRFYYSRIAGSDLLVYQQYDSVGRPVGLYRSIQGNYWGPWTGLSYDAVSRPNAQQHAFMNGVNNIWTGYSYNPAGQLSSRWSNTDAYAFNGYVNVNRGYATNGLNQYTAAGPASFTYDANGNLTSDGSTTFTYDVENRLVQASGARTVNLSYDPLGRLWQVSGSLSGTTRFLYDGDALVAEYDQWGNMLKRYVHGQGADTPQVWFEGAGTSAASRRYLFTNHQGSVTAIADGNGNTIAINRYDEYGIPGSGNIGRFQYTGQAWLEDLGMYHYKARIYSPTLGRFLQTDPIGYDDQINLYAYVANDPVNNIDPSGMCTGSLISNSDGTCKGVGGFNPTLNGAGTVDGPVPSQSNKFSENGNSDSKPGALKGALESIESAFETPGEIIDRLTVSPSEIIEGIVSPDVPSDALETLKRYEENGYSMPVGTHYHVERHINKKGALPEGGNYREMHIRQFDSLRMFRPMGRDRLVVDKDTGRAWYTPDHYKTFIRIK